MRRLALGIFAVTLLCLFTPYLITSVHASEPPLPEIFDYLGFTNVAEVDDETFPAGIYELTLYAEFAAYNEENVLSHYEVGTTIYNVIFAGPEGGFGYITPPIDATIVTDHEFGLSMLTPEGHRYFTENSLNPDGYQHSIVYKNLDDPHMFLIGFENLYGQNADRDYQDIVFSLKLQTPPQVIPEVPLGTILSSVSMLIAFLGFVGFKRFRYQHK